jgi:ligand-binding sensor domain-containing protein
VLWAGTFGKGMSRFDGATWTTYTKDDDIASDSVRSIVFDFEGVVWFGTSRGLSRFDGESWTTYTTEDGLADNSISSIDIDSNGVMWLGTSGGMSRFDGESWKTYTIEEGLVNNHVRAVLVDSDGIIWAGAHSTDPDTGVVHGGLSRFDGETWNTFTLTDGMASNRVASLAEGLDGMLWIGTDSGISKFDKISAFEHPILVESIELLPSSFTITGNYPNPFNPATTIEFSLPIGGLVNLTIYNIMGQEIRTLITESMPAGTHSVRWDGRDNSGMAVSSGIYMSYLTMGSKRTSHRTVLMK